MPLAIVAHNMNAGRLRADRLPPDTLIRMVLQMHPSHLQPGVFYGQTVRHLTVAGLTFTESSYAPGLKLAAHAHEHAYFCLILDGSYTEMVNGRARTCAPCSLLYHPPHEMHSDTFHGKGGRCLSVELDQHWWSAPATSRPPSPLQPNSEAGGWDRWSSG
jgi:hypothetical protein